MGKSQKLHIKALNKGCTYMSSNDYNNSKTYLTKAYELSKESYLYPHINIHGWH